MSNPNPAPRPQAIDYDDTPDEPAEQPVVIDPVVRAILNDIYRDWRV